MRPKHTEIANVEGSETAIGRDPRQMTEIELIELGHVKRPLLRVIRANCVECSGGSEAEVRRCRMVACQFWPYRMGTNPFQHRELSDEQREAGAARLAAARKARAAATLV